MIKAITIAVLLSVAALASPSTSATESGKAPKIAFSTKFRNVDYLFTDQVDVSARADGSDYDNAIRDVGWELISAVGKACNSVEEIQAILIDRINFKGRHSFVVLGVIADKKFLKLDFNGPPPDATLKKLFDAFENEHVIVTRRAEGSGVDLSLAN